METKSVIRSLVLFSAIAMASVPLFAKPLSKTIPVNHSVVVGKFDVKAGEYHFVINDNHLTIMNGKKTIAESEGQWQERDAKSPYTSIVSNGEGKLIELRFAGEKNVFVLAQ